VHRSSRVYFTVDWSGHLGARGRTRVLFEVDLKRVPRSITRDAVQRVAAAPEREPTPDESFSVTMRPFATMTPEYFRIEDFRCSITV